MVDSRPKIAVVGAGECSETLAGIALSVGASIARSDAILLTGGRGGVMAAACRGAKSHGGLTVGVLPGADERETPANPDVDLVLFSGMGQARNLVLVLSADAIIAIGGGWGTLSEIALALKHDRPVVCLESWVLERPDGADETLLTKATSPEEAVQAALEAARLCRNSS